MNEKKQKTWPLDVTNGVRRDGVAQDVRTVRIWALLGALEAEGFDVPSTSEALADLEARIDAVSTTASTGIHRATDRSPIGRKRTLRGWFYLGAGVIAASAFLVAWLWSMPIRVSSPVGGQPAFVELPDGSGIQLNSGSTIEYRRGFKIWPLMPHEEREVELFGEGFFDIERGGAPFIVTTFNAQITVLGTAFNVRAYGDTENAATRVTLEHGRVRVEGESGNHQSVLLTEQGQVAVVRAENAAAEMPSDESDLLEWHTAWRNGGFVVLNESTEAMIAEIERQYGVELQVSDSLELIPMNFIYKNDRPAVEDVLDHLCISTPCVFRENSTGYELLRPIAP